MLKFIAIKMGNFGPVAVNRRMRMLVEEINRLEALILGEAVDAVDAPGVDLSASAPVPDTKTEDSAGTATELKMDGNGAPAVDTSKPKGFDWETSTSLVELRNYAFMDLGLEIAKQVTNPETVRKRIRTHLASLSTED